MASGAGEPDKKESKQKAKQVQGVAAQRGRLGTNLNGGLAGHLVLLSVRNAIRRSAPGRHVSSDNGVSSMDIIGFLSRRIYRKNVPRAEAMKIPESAGFRPSRRFAIDATGNIGCN